jgi:hypothetical protein
MASKKRAESPPGNYMSPPPPPPSRFAQVGNYLDSLGWLPRTPSRTSPSQVDSVPPTLSTGDPSRVARVRNYLRRWLPPSITSPSPVDSVHPILSENDILSADDIKVMNDLNVGMQLVDPTNDRYRDDEHTELIPMDLALASLIFSYYKSHNRFNYFPDNVPILMFEDLNTALIRFYDLYERRGKILHRFPNTDYERLEILLGGMRELNKYHEEVEKSFKDEIDSGAIHHNSSYKRHKREHMVTRKIIAQLEYLLKKAEARQRKYGGKTKRRHNSGKRRHNSGKRRTHARN